MYSSGGKTIAKRGNIVIMKRVESIHLRPTSGEVKELRRQIGNTGKTGWRSSWPWKGPNRCL